MTVLCRLLVLYDIDLFTPEIGNEARFSILIKHGFLANQSSGRSQAEL